MSDEETEPTIRITAPARPEFFGPRYAFSEEKLPHPLANEALRKPLGNADFRNAEIEKTVRDLEQLERRFREGDPVREAIATARRQAAKHYVVTKENGDGLKVVK